jgi:predicted acylesterase/phospholipase RssA
LFSQGCCEKAVRVWSSISPAAILTINLSKITATITQAMGNFSKTIMQKSIIDWAIRLCENQGIFSKDGLSALIEREIKPDCIKAFDGPVFATVFNLSHMKAEYHDLRDRLSLTSIRERLLASASIPVVFGETYVDGSLCWDGGLPIVGDNTPVKPLYEPDSEPLLWYICHGKCL